MPFLEGAVWDHGSLLSCFFLDIVTTKDDNRSLAPVFIKKKKYIDVVTCTGSADKKEITSTSKHFEIGSDNNKIHGNKFTGNLVSGTRENILEKETKRSRDNGRNGMEMLRTT